MGSLTRSERDWLELRAYLNEHRHELGVRAAADDPGMHVAGTPLLAAPGWLPAEPVPLRNIRLELDASEGEVPERLLDAAGGVLPLRADGTRYPSYSAAMRQLSAPRIFANRRTYRLTSANLAQRALSFTLGRYFDGIDTGEAAAHEYAAAEYAAAATGRGAGHGAGVRAAIGDPRDLSGRPVNLAISTLTIHIKTAGRSTFWMHWRDPGSVGHAGGLFQVVPVGVFQPSGDASVHLRNDFSLWRCLVREFAEELLGEGEDHSGPVDYDAWSVARELDRGRAWCVGLGTDPLTFATDLLTVLVIDDDLGIQPSGNTEGRVLPALPFDEETVERFACREPVQAAGAALLKLAWSHRDVLLGDRH